MAEDNQGKKSYACTVYFNYCEGSGGERSADQIVSYKFLKVLEEKLVSFGINLDNVQHYEKLLLGTTVFDLLKSIEDSERCVFILTKGFIKDTWQKFTGQNVIKHMVVTQKQIMVLCIDMPEEEIPIDLATDLIKKVYFTKDDNTWQGDDNWISIKQCFPTVQVTQSSVSSGMSDQQADSGDLTVDGAPTGYSAQDIQVTQQSVSSGTSDLQADTGDLPVDEAPTSYSAQDNTAETSVKTVKASSSSSHNDDGDDITSGLKLMSRGYLRTTTGLMNWFKRYVS